MKNRKRNKRARKVNTNAIIAGGETQKNKAPDSQMSQATCRAKEIDRAHRSHSTREAKQNRINKKNQRSPIKTIKSHEILFCLVPLLGADSLAEFVSPVLVLVHGWVQPSYSVRLYSFLALFMVHTHAV